MFLLILTQLTFAEEPSVVYKEKTEIDFESVEIEGNLKKPNQALITENARAIFNPLVQIRLSWTKEMSNSINNIK